MTERMRISVPLAGGIKLVRRFRTFRSIDLLTVLLDGWCGRLIRATRTGKNGAVLHPLLAGRIGRRIAGMVARANSRRVLWTRWPILVGILGQRRRGAKEDCGYEGGCNV